MPNSPPPSFHSRSSTPPSHDNNVDPTLADAFDEDGDSDDETDDRQRLVRQNSTPAAGQADMTPPSNSTTSSTQGYDTPDSETLSRAQRVVGGGVGTDGVFANMSARPERQTSEKDEQPPVSSPPARCHDGSRASILTMPQTYEQAAADAVPPYWETTILAPGLGGPDEVYVDGLPVGSFFAFIWNGMISTSFQLVGFLLTYLLHSTHAAKNGSRAGLGITLIQYGFFMKSTPATDIPNNMGGPDGFAAPEDPNSHNFDESDVTDGGGFGDVTGTEWLAYVLMVAGWLILIKSTVEYLRARRHEQLVLQSPDRGLGIPVVAAGEPSERVV